jgi:molybdopterin molybdotransferase
LSSFPDALSLDAAIHCVLAGLGPLGTQHVPLTECAGRLLATSIRAELALPAYATSIMDGYAVHSSSLEISDSLSLVGESAAGHPYTNTLASGGTVRISTGAVVPPGANAVVPLEDVEPRDLQIAFGALAREQVHPGRYIRAAGSDVAPGDILLEPGQPLGPGDLALLAAVGLEQVEAVRIPGVAILSTGDELVPLGTTPGPGEIISTNGLMLHAQVEAAGGRVVSSEDVPDRPNAMAEALDRALASADLVLTSGGISVGHHDLVLPALDALGFEVGFRGVRLRPGRPTTFGHVEKLPVLALAGNPASTFVGFELLARPIIRALAGHAARAWQRPTTRVRTLRELEGSKVRDHLVRARLGPDGATPLARQLSGALTSLAGVDALLRVPAGVESVPAHAEVDAILLRHHG